ncbi:hypothetical protein HX807_15030 [Pseudomonas sp. D8002]|uniref:hypothetical protein n=1 Tax=unclassified Pseudomonas TaxID=196821 RepID=UPI00159FB0A5|nr:MULTISPECIES: hypothetical protein [unclassified Pseudomonas]NWA89925.1 hypothetical protein [Pseudomonas sp. D8002]NWB20972.1 hypothetical protein [Pseudomonas sp. D4002]
MEGYFSTGLTVCADLIGESIGKLRLKVLSDSARIVMGKVLLYFIQRYPEVGVEVEVENRAFDIVWAGFNAGVGAPTQPLKTL